MCIIAFPPIVASNIIEQGPVEKENRFSALQGLRFDSIMVHVFIMVHFWNVEAALSRCRRFGMTGPDVPGAQGYEPCRLSTLFYHRKLRWFPVTFSWGPGLEDRKRLEFKV